MNTAKPFQLRSPFTNAAPGSFVGAYPPESKPLSTTSWQYLGVSAGDDRVKTALQ